MMEKVKVYIVMSYSPSLINKNKFYHKKHKNLNHTFTHRRSSIESLNDIMLPSSSSSSSSDEEYEEELEMNQLKMMYLVYYQSMVENSRRRRFRTRFFQSAMLNLMLQQQQKQQDEYEDEDEYEEEDEEEDEEEEEEEREEKKTKADMVKLLEEIIRAESKKYEVLREHAKAVEFEARVRQRELDLQVLYRDVSSLTPKRLLIHQRLFDEINERIDFSV